MCINAYEPAIRIVKFSSCIRFDKCFHKDFPIDSVRQVSSVFFFFRCRSFRFLRNLVINSTNVFKRFPFRYYSTSFRCFIVIIIFFRSTNVDFLRVVPWHCKTYSIPRRSTETQRNSTIRLVCTVIKNACWFAWNTIRRGYRVK